MRFALHLLLIALLAATHLWGGCVSCSKFFMFPWEETVSAGKHCCQKGKCDRESDSTKIQNECKRVAFDRTPEQGVDVELAAIPLEMSGPRTEIRATHYGDIAGTDVDPPPIDRQAVLSSFLI